jgi:sugar lactone lactonase YvrE
LIPRLVVVAALVIAGVVVPLVLRANSGRSDIASASGPSLESPGDLAVAPDGTIFVAEPHRDEILVRYTDGRLAVWAGDGKRGNTGDGGPATNAEITSPKALALSPDGTLYFQSGTSIRAVADNGVISTVAGAGTIPPDRITDGLRARRAAFTTETGLAVSPKGILYVSPQSARAVFKLQRGRLLSVVRASELARVEPRSAYYLGPVGIAFDTAGDLFFYTAHPWTVVVRTPSGTLIFVHSFRAFTETDTNVFAPGLHHVLFAASVSSLVGFSPSVPSRRSHEAEIRIVVKFGPTGHLFPGQEYFMPNGIGVTSRGDIILDGELVDRGGSRGTAVLVEVTPDGHLRQLTTPHSPGF